MATNKPNPQEQKAKLLEQKKELEKKIAEFDTRRAAAVGVLAKRYQLTDLTDDILETEFKSLSEKHFANKEAKKLKAASVEHPTKKN